MSNRKAVINELEIAPEQGWQELFYKLISSLECESDSHSK